MNYLLDTHALIWWLADHQKLSPKAHKLISDINNQIFVSTASVWEIAIKSRLGKIETPENLLELIDEESFTILNISARDAWSIKDIVPHHQDPFDHLLISQAINENLKIISRDKFFDLYDVSVVW